MLPWITALRVFNKGSPSWCVPRKGTVGYDTVNRIRQGQEVKTPKQIMDELERKTVGKPKTERRSATISLDSPTPMETKSAPMDATQRRAFAKKHSLLSYKRYFEDHPSLSVEDGLFEGRSATLIRDKRAKRGTIGGVPGLVAVFPGKSSDNYGNRPSVDAWVLKQPGWEDWAKRRAAHDEKMNEVLVEEPKNLKLHAEIREAYKKALEAHREKYSP